MKRCFSVLFLLISLVSACTNVKEKNNQLIEKNDENTDGKQTAANTITNNQPIVIGEYNTGYTLNDRLTSFFITIGENRSADFSGIEQLQNAERLYITLLDTRYVDFSPLKSLPSLEFVRIGGQGLTAIPDLGDIPTLIWMEILFSRLTSLNGIERITSLESLEIIGNREKLTDISAIRHLEKLKYLSFGNGFYNIDFPILGYLPELVELSINAYGEFDLAGINHLKSLRQLRLTSNITKDIDTRSVYKNIEEIGRITGLKELYLDESISSVEFLVTNVNLERLELIADKERTDYWTVSLPLDVMPLRNLVNLKYLAIRGFELENVEALNDLPNLKYFNTDLFEYE